MEVSYEGRTRLSREMRHRMADEQLTLAEAARRIDGKLSPTTIGRYAQGIFLRPSEATLYLLDRAMRWAPGQALGLVDDDAWKERQSIMTGDGELDAEFSTMLIIANELEGHGPGTCERILRWAAHKCGVSLTPSGSRG